MLSLWGSVSCPRLEVRGVLKWTLAIAGPLGLVYLLTSHPQLLGPQVMGFSALEITGLHGALALLTACIAILFSRSRTALVALLSFGYAAMLPDLVASGFEHLVLSLAYLGAGLVLVAGPEKRLFRVINLIWAGLAGVVSLGLVTLIEVSDANWTSAVCAGTLALWGSGLVYLRTRKQGGLSELFLVGGLVGTAFLSWTLGFVPGSFSEAGFQLLAALFNGACLASIVEHSFRLAYIDELTEIPGRRALVEALDDPGQTFTLAMLDVDHFKKFNDTHGHDVGDQVLRMVAARISTVSEGSAYRYGGEEFTLLFPGKTTDDVGEELERIRGLVEASPLFLRGKDRPKKKPKNPRKSPKKKPSVSVTVSIGVATRRPSETWDRVMKRADQALYKAKEGGRNRVAEAS